MSLPLSPLPDAPFAIALSGGGDSTALVHALAGRKPTVFIIDHGLRAGSRLEAEKAQDFARSLSLSADILTWSPPSITTGVQAKARAARYALLGAACRAHGIKHLLTGHTEDDQAETVLMRMDAGTAWRGAAGIAPCAYAPIWPALWGVSLWRPMLGFSRAAVRDYIALHDLPFTDDPSNENRDFTRIRARDRLRARPQLRADMLALSGDMRLGRQREAAHLLTLFNTQVRATEDGFHLRRTMPPYLLGLLIQAAGGSGAQIDSAKLRAMLLRLKTTDSMTATLMGGQIIKTGGNITIIRNPGAALGRANKAPIRSQTLSIGQTLWDGRIVINAHSEGYRVSPLSGHMAALPRAMRDRVLTVPAPARATLPLIWDGDRPVSVGFDGVKEQLDVQGVFLSRPQFTLKQTAREA